MTLTKSQIDRLGERLKQSTTDDDLHRLNTFRASFRSAYTHVQLRIREATGIEPSGRDAKSVPSIIAKLQRETARLSQIQDIAGLRILVRDVAEQDRLVEHLLKAFPSAAVIDRRKSPNHGYRAVHLVVRVEDRLVEIQVRTLLQHQWAEFSEAISDRFPGVKYGEGDSRAYRLLIQLSDWVRTIEGLERDLADESDPRNRRTIEKDLAEHRRYVSGIMEVARSFIPHMR